MSVSLKALVIADTEDQARRLLHLLLGENIQIVSERVDTPEDLGDSLRGGDWDVVLAHPRASRLKPTAAFDVLMAIAPDMPFLCIGEEAGREVTEIGLSLSGHFREEQQRLEAQLRESESKYRQLFERAPIGIFRSTIEGKLVEANPIMFERTGYESLEALNQVGLIKLYVDPSDRRRLIEQAEQGAVSTMETRFRCADGRVISVMLQAQMIRDEQGRPRFLEGILEDITERKRAETALQESENRLRALVETISDWAWETDSEGRITYTSPRIVELLGYQPEEVTGKPLLELMSTEEANRMEPVLEGLGESESPVRLEHKMVDKEGKEVWLESYCMPYFQADGRFAGYRGVDRNITQRRLAEQALRESQQMLQLVLDTIPVRVFWKDRNSVYLGCNKAFAEDANLASPEEIVGMTDHDLLWKPEETEFYISCDRRVMGTDTPEYHIIEPQLRKDGSEAWLDTNKIPLHDANGRVVGVLGTYEDITELKRQEVELAKRNVALIKANEELERLHKVKDEFIAMVSHEFRTPLVTGKGYLELLLAGRLGYLSDEAHEKMAIALRNLNRLSRLIDNILTFHRMSKKEIQYQPCSAPVNLESLFSECADEFQIRTGWAEDRVRVRIEPGTPPVLADEEMLRQVLSNLLSNAERHAGSQATVTVSAGPVVGSKVRVRVIDDGIGMPPDRCRIAFEPFVSSSSLSGGTGLGLAIVRAIVEAHGSLPVLESDAGRGTTVWFDLPRADGKAT